MTWMDLNFLENDAMKKIIMPIVATLILGVNTYAFSDVASDAWYVNTVTNMSEKGYLSGYNDNTFRPENNISAAELVTILSKIKGVSPSVGPSAHWASGYMQSALDKGWYDWDEFPPTAEKYDEPISRQIAAKIMVKALFPEAKGDYNTASKMLSDFSSVDGRYIDGVLAAYSQGIMTGDNNGNFNPKKGLTRAEACSLLERALSKAGLGDVKVSEPVKKTVVNSKGISANGRLHVEGTRLCNQNGETVVLNGMSTHGLQWFPQFTSQGAIKAVGDRGANVMRFAMYTDENGYISSPSVKNTLINGVDAALANDMYAIIDWHILRDGDPLTYKEQSKAFFTEMANKYKGNPGVIYEICNEPNGNVSWQGNIKPYADELITTIRSIDSDAIILVGCADWCQRLEEVVSSPLQGKNIMYTCHFYAGTHTQWLRDKVASALNSGIPIFISEWGTSAADGSNGVYIEEAQRWVDFMNSNNISRCNWSLCDKAESSAALNPGANANDGIDNGELSASGSFVFSQFN